MVVDCIAIKRIAPVLKHLFKTHISRSTLNERITNIAHLKYKPPQYHILFHIEQTQDSSLAIYTRKSAMYYQACYSRIQIDVARLQIQVDGFSCTLPQLKVHDLLFLCRNNYIA